jgi:hypothetical protein
VPARLLAHFLVLHGPDPSPADAAAVFGATLRAHYGAPGAGFAPDVAWAADRVAPVLALRLWVCLRRVVRPSPAAPHAVFGLGDVARAVQGVCSVGPREVPDAGALLTLLLHEAERELGDKVADGMCLCGRPHVLHEALCLIRAIVLAREALLLAGTPRCSFLRVGSAVPSCASAPSAAPRVCVCVRALD